MLIRVIAVEFEFNRSRVYVLSKRDDNLIVTSERALTQFMDWTNNNRMKCNTAKCKELVIRKKCNNSIYPEMFNIKQYDRVTLLGVTYCRFD